MINKFTDNTDIPRFELEENEKIAYADYNRNGKILSIKYVFSPESLRGTGAAGRLMEAIAAQARAENLRITPICGYAASWLQKHKEHHDLMA